jgi:hypothetical protein
MRLIAKSRRYFVWKRRRFMYRWPLAGVFEFVWLGDDEIETPKALAGRDRYEREGERELSFLQEFRPWPF